MVGIYKIVSPTNKIYIGQSKNIAHRKSCYRGLFCKSQVKLYHSLKKHGWDAHTLEVLFELREDIKSRAACNNLTAGGFHWRYKSQTGNDY